jgi:hypothetical protein
MHAGTSLGVSYQIVSLLSQLQAPIVVFDGFGVVANGRVGIAQVADGTAFARLVVLLGSDV